MEIPKNKVIDLPKKEGHSERPQQLEQELPDTMTGGDSTEHPYPDRN